MSQVLNNLVKKVKELTKEVNSNPSEFNDTLATKVSWEPQINSYKNFKSSKLKIIDSSRLMYVPSLGTLITSSILILIGIGPIGLFIYALFYGTIINFSAILFVPFFGIIWIIVGLFIRYSVKIRNFDKVKGYYWVGKKPARAVNGTTQNKNKVPLEQIHAIQLIRKKHQGSDTTVTGYELNLILKDTSRLNIENHSSLRAVRKNASQLGRFLNVPVWDPTL